MVSRSGGVKLAAKLPKGGGNGLAALAEELAADPHNIRMAVIIFDVSKVTRDLDTHEDIPTVRVRRIEPIDATAHATLLRAILMNAWNQRTSDDMLPMELEVDVDAALGDRTTLREADR